MKTNKQAASRRRAVINEIVQGMRTAQMRAAANMYGAANFSDDAIFEIKKPRVGLWRGGC